jgi:GR25 family glycosyltransferase involved in LPS biosynthesis
VKNLNDYFEKIYLINLDSRPDRFEKADQELKKADIKYSRYPAKSITYEDINLKYCKLFENKEKKYIAGACGCRLSHLSIILEAKKNKYKNILIFEDDVKISPDIHEVFYSGLQQLKDEGFNFDMLYFGGWYQHGGYYKNGSKWYQEYIGPNVLKLKGAMTTLAYALNESVYDFILKNALISGREIDLFYYEEMHKKQNQFNYFGLIPTCVQNNDSFSNIK